MKVTAVIPTLGERPELGPLLAQLIREGIDTLTLGCPGENLHHLWNQGARLARDWRQAEAIAILNDDIALPPRAIAAMAEAMTAGGFACVGVDPRASFGVPSEPQAIEVTGWAGRLMTEVTTWCFLVQATAWVDIDEQYEWWWGVGDLFTKIQKNGGRLGQVRGLGIQHVGSGTASRHPWTELAKIRDARRWETSH